MYKFLIIILFFCFSILSCKREECREAVYLVNNTSSHDVRITYEDISGRLRENIPVTVSESFVFSNDCRFEGKPEPANFFNYIQIRATVGSALDTLLYSDNPATNNGWSTLELKQSLNYTLEINDALLGL